MEGTEHQPPKSFQLVYEKASEIINRAKEQTSFKDNRIIEIIGKECSARLDYVSRLSSLSLAVTELTEFKELERELLPLGLGIKIVGTIRGGQITPERRGEWSPAMPLKAVFDDLGLFHDILAHEKPETIWARIRDVIEAKPITVKYLLGLHGCDFPQGFKLLRGSVVEMTRDKRLSLGSRADSLTDKLYPDYLIDGDPKGARWYLELAERRETTQISHSSSLPLTREKILDKFWPELLILSLCHPGFFNIVEVVESVPGWNLEVAPVLDMSDSSPWWGYSPPDRDSVEWAEWADAFYGIADWNKFHQCVELFVTLLKQTLKSKYWAPEAIQTAARWLLRGRLIEHPRVERDGEYEDTYKDVLLHYVIGMENLLMLSSERDGLADKVAVRGAWLVGRSDDERHDVFRLIKQAYNERSKLVQRSGKKKNDKGRAPIGSQRIRDTCRRAMGAALIVSADSAIGKNFDVFLSRLVLSQRAQKLAENAAKQIGELSRCW